jgi:hypothetical protein
VAIGINWKEIWAPVWAPVWRQTAPSTTGSGGKRIPEGYEIDVRELRRAALQAENNARAAVLMAIAEADDL